MNIEYLTSSNFWSKTKKVPSGCIIWQMSAGSHGYGQTWDGTTVLLAHRVAWTLTHGEIPEQMTIDHLCFVRKCVNVQHLRLLSNEENGAGNLQSRKTHCPHGHEYTQENTRIVNSYHTGKVRYSRACKKCQKISNDKRKK